MIPEYSRTFRVRYYECDAYGHLNNATYLRYMQEAAFDASADVGYDLTRYEQLGIVWLIRETSIKYIQPVVYGDSVTVTTRVYEMSKVRSIREYVLTNAETGEKVAEGTSDWVLMDMDTQRPTAIPDEMVRAFLPEGTPENHTRHRFPNAPEPPVRPFVLRRKVEWADVDPMQHVNNAVYAAYIEEAAVQAVASFGWSMARMLEENIAVVATEHRIAYEQPALPGEWLNITTYLARMRRVSGTRHFNITREADGTRLARAYTRWACINTNTWRPAPMPTSIVADFAEHVAR